MNNQTRLRQCYLYVTHELNKMGIRPDGRQLHEQLQAEAEEIKKTVKPSTVEVQVVMMGFLALKVRYEGVPGADELFAAHPDFQGLTLGKLTCTPSPSGQEFCAISAPTSARP